MFVFQHQIILYMETLNVQMEKYKVYLSIKHGSVTPKVKELPENHILSYRLPRQFDYIFCNRTCERE